MSTTVAIGVWLGLATGVFGYQLAAVVSRGALPTFGAAASSLARWRLARWFLLSGWVWLGWHTFVRSHVGGP